MIYLKISDSCDIITCERKIQMKENRILMQYFEWYLKPEDKLWQKVSQEAIELKKVGITDVWLPPAYKCAGGKFDAGYAVYDLYDLGEFNQKGSIETKYGTKEDYLACIQAFQKAGIDVYGDIVLNHKMGADGTEIVNAKEVNRQNTNEIISGDEIKNILILFGIGIILMGLIMMKRPIVIPFSFLIKKVGIKKSMMKMAIMII